MAIQWNHAPSLGFGVYQGFLDLLAGMSRPLFGQLMLLGKIVMFGQLSSDNWPNITRYRF
jgi:hypothetical protein